MRMLPRFACVCCSVLQCVAVCHDTHTQTWAASAYEASFLEIRYICTYIRVYAYTYMYMHTRTCVQMNMCVPGRHRHPREMPLFRKSEKYARIYKYMHTRTWAQMNMCVRGRHPRKMCKMPLFLKSDDSTNLHTYTCLCIHVHVCKRMCANACVRTWAASAYEASFS